MLKRAALMVLCSVIISVGAAQGKKEKNKKEKNITIFSIEGNLVSVDEFTYLYKKNHQNKDEDFTDQKIEEYLTLFINFKLKVQEARWRGMDTTAAFVSEYNSYSDELRKPYLPDAKLTDSLVLLTYDRMKYEVKASHILINVKFDAPPKDTLKGYTRIMEIRKSILGGEDFSTAAAAYSEDPSAKVNQGSLGYFTAMQMVYPFETAAYLTTPGNVSMPVRTRFGYHIIKVFDKRQTKGEVEVSHIMMRTGDEKDNEKAKNAIFSIYEQLQAGVKWEELCSQYSEDPATKNNGGRLRPIRTGTMAAIPEFENAAFNLENSGEISDPVQTQYGWHIIRLEKKIPLLPLESLEPTLRTRVLGDERTALSKQALLDKLRKEYELAENQSVKALVIALADSSIQIRGWKKPNFSNAEKEMLFFLHDKGYSVQDFLSYAQKNQRPNTQPPAKYFEQLYNNFIDSSILQLMEEKIIAENPTYSFLLKEYYEGILLFEIMEKEVWNKASEDSVGQRNYYESHVSEYMAGERVAGVLYSSNTSEFRTPLQNLLVSQEEDKINAFVSARKVNVESGFYKRADKSIFQQMPWASGVYSAENKGIYYLAWLKDILPPGPMSFEESRPAIISDYQVFLEEIWLLQLKKKFAVKVNEKGKRYILQQLQAN